MSRLLDVCETRVSPSYRLLGLVDTSVDTCLLDAEPGKWLLSAPGMVYLQVPSEVVRASVRLESWTTRAPVSDASWSGSEEVEVELPEGELALFTIDSGQWPVSLVLPWAGVFRMRWHWIFNPERGPFTSPVADVTELLPKSAGFEESVMDTEIDQHILIQIWRTAAVA
ncbi:hypothetical protein [Streptomyces sp. NPDC096339]|uniref:hypothetical protein n=1 Tax=Streptomyces sp. NPDC096339 TaxID=3366086 RepID=UPI0037FA214E